MGNRFVKSQEEEEEKEEAIGLHINATLSPRLRVSFKHFTGTGSTYWWLELIKIEFSLPISCCSLLPFFFRGLLNSYLFHTLWSFTLSVLSTSSTQKSSFGFRQKPQSVGMPALTSRTPLLTYSYYIVIVICFNDDIDNVSIA